MAPRLPQPGGDAGNWGEILNDYLSQEHNDDGTLKDVARPDELQGKADAADVDTLASRTDVTLNPDGTLKEEAITALGLPTGSEWLGLTARVDTVSSITRLLPIALSEGAVSTAVQVLGDSTGNYTGEWVDLVGHDIADAYPDWEVRHYTWDTIADTMRAPDIIQSAPNGERHLAFGGTANQVGRYSGAAVTDDLDVRVRVELDDWTPSTPQTLTGLFASPTNRSWRFFVNSGAGSTLGFDWSVNGSTLQTVVNSAAWSPPAGPVWVRVTLDVDNGASGHAIAFYQSVDGATWTQIGSTTTRASTTSIYASSSQYEIAGRYIGTLELLIGDIYEVQIRDGIGGPSVAPCLPELWEGTSARPEPTGSPILSLVNGSYAGGTLAIMADSSRLKRMTPNYGQALTMVSISHNEVARTGQTLFTDLLGYLDDVRERLPHLTLFGLTQNPRIAPANARSAQAKRRLDYISWAADLNWVPIDTYGAFLSDPQGLTALTNPADGIHPSDAGSRVWADEVKRALGLN